MTRRGVVSAGPGARAVVLLLVLACTLTGCASIPKTGPVTDGRPGGASDPREGVFEVIPNDPSPGASPGRTVRDFVRAAAGFRDSHRVARRFLAPSRRLTWRPDAKVTVYPVSSEIEPVTIGDDGQRRVDSDVRDAGPKARPEVGAPTATGPAAVTEQENAARVSITVPVQAVIDGRGRYNSASAGERQTIEFELIRIAGEWQIDGLDEGILVSSSDFTGSFRPFPIYFPEHGGRYLVPEVRWYPGTLEVPTALVRGLLAGPSDWLRDAVTTGAPPGTQMAVAAVVVADQVATVDLTDQVRSASARQRQLLARQLEATLTSLRTISGVKITVRGVDFDIPARIEPGNGRGEAPGNSLQVNPQVDPRPVVIDGKGKIARFDGSDRLVPVEGVNPLAVPGASHPAVARAGDVFAVLGPARGSLLLQAVGAPKAERVVDADNLTAPSFDPLGFVWTAAADTAVVFAVRPGGRTGQVDAPWLRRARVLSLRASRDGARLLLTYRQDGAVHAAVSGVVRDGDGRPQRLTEPQDLVPDLTSALDATWVDEDEVVVLGQRSGSEGPPGPWLVQVGGTVTSASPLEEMQGAESITAGNGPLTLVAGSPTGLLTRVGARWEPNRVARWPAFPG